MKAFKHHRALWYIGGGLKGGTQLEVMPLGQPDVIFFHTHTEKSFRNLIKSNRN